jgi:hypothetical protein
VSLQKGDILPPDLQMNPIIMLIGVFYMIVKGQPQEKEWFCGEIIFN